YWQYALSLPNIHFLSHAFADSMALARAKKSSWISDIVHVLATLHRPIHIDLFQPWSSIDIDAVVAAVEQSCLTDINAFLTTSPKIPLLRHRSDSSMDGAPLQRPAVCSFRAYLNIPIPAHRKAVVQLLTLSHALAL
ncbi:hypothetical protein IW262DRAFT_1240088, partial [Armillaria fumosa]